MESATERANYINTTLEGCLVVAAGSAIASFIGVYALDLGATNTQVGLLTALPYLANSLAVMATGRTLSHRTNLMAPTQITGFLHRFFLLLMLVAPFLPGMSVWWIIGMYSLASASLAVSAAAWTSMVSDIFPPAHRGAVFGTRAIFTGSAGVVATIIAGKCLDLLPIPWNYTVVFMILSIAALGAVYLLGKLKLPPPVKYSAANDIATDWHPLAKGNTSRQFRQLVQPVFFFSCGFFMLAPVQSIYFVDHLGYTNGQIGLLSAIFLVCQVASSRFWGRIGDRVGTHLVAGVVMMILALQALLYLLQPNIAYLIVLQSIGGFAYGGYAISTFNTLIVLGSRRERHLLVTWFNVISYVAGFISPIIGTFVLDQRGLIPAFMLAAIIRGIGAWLMSKPARQEWRQFRQIAKLS